MKFLDLHTGHAADATLPVGLVVAEARDAFPQDEQRVVDVSGLLQPLADGLGFVAALRAGEVAQRKPEKKKQTSPQTYMQNVRSNFREGTKVTNNCCALN